MDTLRIRSGNWEQQPSNVRIVDESSLRSSRNRGTMCLLIETLPGRALASDLQQELLDTMENTYYNLSGSTTRGLREALVAANAFLFERNLRTDSAHRMIVGITCVIIRDSDVYIGQLGPSMVTHVTPERSQHYPQRSVWLDEGEPGPFDVDREPPAGLRKEAEPDLHHATLAPDDVLIISTTTLARMAEPGELAGAVRNTGRGSVRDAIEVLAEGQDVTVIILSGPEAPSVTVTPGLPTSRLEPEPPAPEPAVPQHGDEIVGAPAPEPVTEPPLVSDEDEDDEHGDGLSAPASGPGILRGLLGSRRSAPAKEPAPQPEVAAEDEPAWDDGDQEPETYSEDAYADTTGAYSDTYDEPVTPRQPREPLVDVDQVRDSLSHGARRVREGTEEVLLRVLPDKVPERPDMPEPEDEPISLSGRALVAVAMAIPLIMLFIVVVTRIQYERTRQEQFTSLQSLAQARYDAALKQPDSTAMRQELYDALRSVRQGLALTPKNEELQALERRIVHKLDEVDNITRLYHFWKLYEFEDDAMSATDSSRLVVHGIDLFVLNRGSDRVYKFLLNDVGDALQSVDASPVLLERGQMRGGVELGDIVDIAWIKEGGQRKLSTFVALERRGSLLAYNPQQGIDVLPVANSDIWLNPQAIGGYYGNLYVLDPLLNRILKYTPVDNAYTVPPADYLRLDLDIDLTGAVDMTIDGNIYVLFADGQILRYFQGEPKPFSMEGLPTPMNSPTTIFVSGPQEPDAEGFVYVNDTGNDRVLQFTKEGQFVQQFQDKLDGAHMDQLRGIYVDEERQRMFILNGNTLWQTSIKPEG
jgi:hypothetical protein